MININGMTTLDDLSFNVIFSILNTLYNNGNSLVLLSEVWLKINTTIVSIREGSANPSDTTEFTPGCQWGSRYSLVSCLCSVE
jgi:hypothetical protein